MLLVVWSAWVATTWVTSSSTRIMRVSDAKCAYCERRHWARETGDARNLVADRQVSLPDGRYCHARCFGHYVIEVGLAEVLGMTRPRQRQLARARLGLPSAKGSLQFATVRQVCRQVGAHPPEVSQWNQQALARLERMAKTAEMEASQHARRQEVLSRV